MSDTDEKQEERGKPIVVGISIGSGRGKGGKCSPLSGLIWGVIVALVGVVILLDNMGIIEARHLYRYSPSLLILAGILNLGSRSSRIFGIILILAGALFQLGALGIGHFTWGTLWALIFIAVGLSIIWGSIEGRTRRPPSAGETSNTMNAVAVFSGVERRISSQDFQFGRVMAIFGGAEIDLRQAGIQQETAELEVNAIFGGAEIRVPDSWQVVSRGQFVFAGFSDKTRDVSTVDLSNPNRKTLVISGISLFGGVEIKN
jgi:predicted membrane protein